MDDLLLPRHPIRVVAQRTGLTTATIRAWERRYHAVTPIRSEGGQRLYSDRDVTRLRTLKQLTEAGRSISMVAELGDSAAENLLTEDRVSSPSAVPVAAEVNPERWIEEAYALIRTLDAETLERTLWRTMMTHGARVFLTDVVAPLLARVGAGWRDGEITPGQEHLGSEVIDRVLERLAERLPHTHGPRLVICTLPGERHGLGGRLAAVAAVLDGWRVINLGTDLPVHDIAMTAQGLDASAVAISLVRREDVSAAADSLIALRELLAPSIEVLVGGGAARLLPLDRLPKGVHVLHGLDGFAAFLPSARTKQGRLRS